MFARLTIVLIHLVALATLIECEQQHPTSKQPQAAAAATETLNSIGANQPLAGDDTAKASNQSRPTGLEARAAEHSGFVKDILERLHALDADIGKLLFNSTSMYAPNDEGIVSAGAGQRGGEKFTEVLNDLDALQDELGGLINNATRTRQYNMLVRLRPINNILYRIRHNLHLMRNSLVAINAVSSLEKIGNSVLDSTLSAFMRPDANLNDELGDDGNYDFNLDRPQDLPAAGADRVQSAQSTTSASPTSTTTTTTTTSTTSTTTTTTPKPTTTTTSTTTTTAVAANSTASRAPALERASTTTRRPTVRPPPRRSNNRQGQRRTTAKPTLAPRAEPAAEHPQ